MKNLKCPLAIAFCLFMSTAFCQDKAADALKGINVYFPNSEVSGKKLNLNVQGRIVAIPLCKVDIAKVDDHNFSFASTDKSEKIMRGDEPTTSVKLQLVHSACDKLVGLLQSLQSAECGK
jgi:hypothetical protein